MTNYYISIDYGDGPRYVRSYNLLNGKPFCVPWPGLAALFQTWDDAEHWCLEHIGHLHGVEIEGQEVEDHTPQWNGTSASGYDHACGYVD